MAQLIVAGNATASQVLAGSTFSAGSLNGATGTMPNRGANGFTPTTTNQTIPEGYYNGTGVVSGDPDLVTGNIRSGANIFGVAGKSSVVETNDASAVAGDILSTKSGYVNGVKISGSMTNRGAVNITPSTSNQTIAAGYHNGTGVVYGDANLVASNIIDGANIFGVNGAAIVGKRFATGTYSVTSATKNFVRGTSGEPTESLKYVEITGLNFPQGIALISLVRYTYGTIFVDPSIYTSLYSYVGGGAQVRCWWDSMNGSYAYKHDQQQAYVNTTGFCLPVPMSSEGNSVTWVVVGK